ncbi:MAG: protein kinase [Gemmatimonadetes bacterium]|nr:protein kinase [Gemmatimonadota bacterium]
MIADPITRLNAALEGRYRIESELGEGGMANVYLADDLKHERKVALKVLKPELAHTLGPERFLREIEIAAGLTHPHILPLHDSGEADGFLYYVMPFIAGESLRDRLSREGRLPIRDCTRIFREIVDALGEAHRGGILHRDVKPANVLLAGGHALVADFGIARAVSEVTDRPRLTSVGMSLGTPQYMSPEQAAADQDADHRADLFAAGAIGYEMLTGTSPFAASTPQAVLAALLTREPDPPAVLREGVPRPLSDAVMWCLEKNAAERPQSAAELVEHLETVETAPRGSTPWHSKADRKRRRSLLVYAPLAVAIVAGGAFGSWRWDQQRDLERWALAEAIPEVMRLQGANRMAEAAALGQEVERTVGPHPMLEPMWPLMSTPLRITTEPPGADVMFRPYEAEEDEWQPLGKTPYETARFPVGAFRFRLEMEGFEPVDKVRSFITSGLLDEIRSSGIDYMADPSYAIDVALAPTGSVADGMISVPGGLYTTVPITGFAGIDPRPVPGYLIDRTEVTSEAYLAFVEDGGYEDPSYWQQSLMRDGEEVSWDEAMQGMLDSTGRAGPSTWLLGQPPAGTGAHPVGGVSWFEAEAYCRWRGASLPTLYHWARAALPSTDVWVPFNHILARASNFDGEGPQPVGARNAMGISGAQDIVGNVREWVTTAGGDDRYLMGGAWSDPLYFIHDAYPFSPWQRDPTNGVRCARYPDGEPPTHLQGPITFPEQDFSGSSPAASMSDEAFAMNQRFAAYDKSMPLADSLESRRTLDWGATEEWVSIDAAYGGERLPIRIHLPRDAEPPYEAFIFFGGGNVIRSSQIEEPRPPVDFLVRSGRVLIEPMYEGTFSRNDGRTAQRLTGPASQELFTHWIQDIARTIDYLEERPDIDADRISYFGLSLGAAISPDLLPHEPRFKAAILYSGGFGVASSQARIDYSIALLRRIRIPVLQLGGRRDFSHPIDPHQREFLRHFGTVEEDKHQFFFDAGHQPLPLTDVIRHSVDFLERYVR